MGQFSEYNKKVKEAKSGGAFLNFTYGTHRIKLGQIRTLRPRKGGGLAVIIKAEIKETEAAPLNGAASLPGANRVGMSPELYIPLDSDTGPGLWRDFLIAASGLTEEEFDALSEEDMEELEEGAVGVDQIYSDTEMTLDVRRKRLKLTNDKIKAGDLDPDALEEKHFRPTYNWTLNEAAVEEAPKKAAGGKK